MEYNATVDCATRKMMVIAPSVQPRGWDAASLNFGGIRVNPKRVCLFVT